jgi:hypothetical protein
MTTEIVEAGLWVLTVKVALVEPTGTVTLAGTPAKEVLLLESATTAPPAGAGALSVTLPVEGSLPWTLVGLSVTDDRTGPAPGVDVGSGVDVAVGTGVAPDGKMVSVAVRVTPAPDTEIVTVVAVETGCVLTRKPPANAPCGT